MIEINCYRLRYVGFMELSSQSHSDFQFQKPHTEAGLWSQNYLKHMPYPILDVWSMIEPHDIYVHTDVDDAGGERQWPLDSDGESWQLGILGRCRELILDVHTAKPLFFVNSKRQSELPKCIRRRQLGHHSQQFQWWGKTVWRCMSKTRWG